MATIHFIQQGKGGVGKSMIAAFLVQALRHIGHPVLVIDADPVNATLAGFKEFNAVRLQIMKGDNIDARVFDEILELVMPLDAATHVVIDTGASSFVSFGGYLKENTVVQLFQEAGHRVFFHTIITGGQAITDTVYGLKVMAQDFASAPIVVWLNSYFGEIAMDGKVFEEFNIYKEHSHQFHAIISLPEKNPITFGRDLQDLLAKRMTFQAGITSSTFGIASKSRLKTYWTELLTLVEQAQLTSGFVPDPEPVPVQPVPAHQAAVEDEGLPHEAGVAEGNIDEGEAQEPSANEADEAAGGYEC